MTKPQVTAQQDGVAIRAVVGKVRGEGGLRFAVAYLEDGVALPGIGKGEDITFSLSDWQGAQEPRKEQVVLLERIQLFRNGWRALSARPIALNLGSQKASDKKEQS